MELDKRPRKRSFLGISLFILAALFMAFMGATVKGIGPDQTTASILFWRNCVGLIFLFPWLLIQKAPLKEQLKISSIKIHLIRGASNFLAIFFYFYSLNFLSLSNATLLFNTIPIFIPIVAYLWQRIIILKVLWWGIGIAFLGIIIALDPRQGLFQPASLLALLSGIFGAVSLVSLRLGHYSETSSRMMFYLFTINLLLATLFSLFSFEKSWGSLSLQDFSWMMLIGVFGFLYQIASTAGAKFVPVRLGGIFIFFSVIFAFFLDYWIWEIKIPLSTYLGCALIILGVTLKVILYPKDDIQIKSSTKT